MTEILEVEARLKDFLSDKLGVITEKLNTTSKSADKTASNLNKTQFSVSNLAKGMVAGAVALTGFRVGLDSVKSLLFGSLTAYDGQIKAVVQLNNSVNGNTEALQKQASALQNITDYGDEAIIAGQAMLGTYQLNTKQIEELTPKILDFAALYDMDLKSAFMTVGKSITTNSNMLSRYMKGVTGGKNETEKFTIINKALTDSFSGQAEAMGKVGLGSWVRVKKAMGDVQEVIGQQLQPILESFTKWTLDNMPKIAKVGFNVGKAIVISFNLAKAGINAVLTVLNNSLGLVMSGVEKMYTGIAKVYELAAKVTGIKLFKDWEASAKSTAGYFKLVSDEFSNAAQANADNTIANFDKIKVAFNSKMSDFKMPTEGKRKVSTPVEDLNEDQIKAITDLVQARTEKRLEIAKLERDEIANLQNDKFALIESEYLKESALLNLKYEREREVHKNNAQALAELEKNKNADLLLLTKNRTAKEEDLLKENQDKAKLTLEERRQAQFKLVSDTANNLKTMTGLWKGFGRASQVMAIAQTTWETYQGAQSAFTSAMEVVPYPFNLVAAPAAAGAAIGAGLANINSIRQQKFSTGGIVGGSSFTGDRVPALLNSNERVLTTGQQKILSDTLMQGGNNSNKNYNITLNLSGASKVDNSNISEVNMSLSKLGELLVKADRAGELDNFKGRLKNA